MFLLAILPYPEAQGCTRAAINRVCGHDQIRQETVTAVMSILPPRSLRTAVIPRDASEAAMWWSYIHGLSDFSDGQDN